MSFMAPPASTVLQMQCQKKPPSRDRRTAGEVTNGPAPDEQIAELPTCAERAVRCGRNRCPVERNEGHPPLVVVHALPDVGLSAPPECHGSMRAGVGRPDVGQLIALPRAPPPPRAAQLARIALAALASTVATTRPHLIAKGSVRSVARGHSHQMVTRERSVLCVLGGRTIGQ